MTNAALDWMQAAEDVELGPAEVLEVTPVGAKVQLEDGRAIFVTLALAVPYEPAIGDELLVIGKGGRAWAIGLVHGTGKLALAVNGDVDVHAIGGELRLRGDRGVSVHGEEIDLVAKKLKVAADSAIETFSSLVRRVSGLLSVRARDQHTVVDNASYTHAKRASIQTEEIVTINGKQVHLG